MTLYVAPIVEGQTEVGCIEFFLQGVWTKLLRSVERMQVLRPARGNRDALIQPNHTELAEKIKDAYAELSRHLRRDSSGRGLLLLLFDAEQDCPASLAPRLLERARAARSDADVICVLAKRELENWFKAGAASLAGVCGLPNPLSIPPNPEDGDGGAWLTRQMRRQNRHRRYTKPTDAVELAKHMDLQQCRDHSPSFDKLCRDLEVRKVPTHDSTT